MVNREHQDYNERQVIFVLTEKCNLRCIYCYETNKNKNEKTLTADFIKNKISSEMLEDNLCKKIWFIFFGGEPLLEYEIIREVVEWTDGETWPEPVKEYHFMVETNGTLLNENMKKWFNAHRKHVTLSLSLDGTEAAHNRNRSNSYAAVIKHIDFYRENWPKQPVKMTVGPDTLDQIYDGVVNIHDMGLSAEFDVLFEDVWGDEDSERRALRIWAEQLEKLIAFYSTHPKLQRPSVLNRMLDRLFDRPSERSFTYCGAGKHLTCYTPGEYQYPCFRFAPLVVNNPLKDVLKTPDLLNEKCESCSFMKLCPTCEGHNYEVNGSCFKRTDFHCRFFKLSLLATAKMMYIDHPEYLYNPSEVITDEEKKERMRKLLATRVVNDLCKPVLDWAMD